MKLSQDAIQICLDYGHGLMLTNKEILNAIDNMTEEEFCVGAMYNVLGKARKMLNKKWQKKDLRNEYHL
jgi:hypothetical protein